MDWVQSAITSSIVLGGIAARELIKRGRADKDMESVKDDVKEHGSRLDQHDDRFEQLNTIFMPRTELQETFKAIHRSNDRQERMLEALILPRVRPINPDDGN